MLSLQLRLCFHSTTFTSNCNYKFHLNILKIRCVPNDVIVHLFFIFFFGSLTLIITTKKYLETSMSNVKVNFIHSFSFHSIFSWLERQKVCLLKISPSKIHIIYNVIGRLIEAVLVDFHSAHTYN